MGVVDLGELCSRICRGSRVASSGRWSRQCAGCSGTSSFILHPGDGARRCAGCSGTLTHPEAEGAAHLDLVLYQSMRDEGGSRARHFAECRGMSRPTDDLRSILSFFQRNEFGVGDVCRWNKDFLLGEGAWSVSPSPWPVLRQEFSIPENARRQCKNELRPLWVLPSPLGAARSLISASHILNSPLPPLILSEIYYPPKNEPAPIIREQ
jgi:hypothetical protein